MINSSVVRYYHHYHVNADAAANNVNNANIMPPVDLVSNPYIDILKEIIMCDYIPKTDDDLLSLATLVKSRKKVTGLLTKGIEQQDADPAILLDISRLYDPDDDKEEREERRKFALERLEELEETLRQVEGPFKSTRRQRGGTVH